MPRKTRNVEELLQDREIKTILEYFLIKGEDKGIKFSEIKEYTRIEPSSTLYGKLQQLKRTNILFQKSKGGPYFLAGKYYNYVFHKYLVDRFNDFSYNPMMGRYSHLGYGNALYGIYPELLDKEDNKKLNNISLEFDKLLWDIKEKQVEKILKNIKNKLRELLLSELENLSERKKDFLVDFSNNVSWVTFSSFLYTKVGSYPDTKEIKEITKKYFYFEEEWQSDLIAKIVSLILPSFEHIYPLQIGYFVYSNMNSWFMLLDKLYPEELTGTEINPEMENYMNIHEYLTKSNTEFDYIHYANMQVENAKEEKDIAYAYGIKSEIAEADKKLEYWEQIKKRVNSNLSIRERRKYGKKLLEYIKGKFTDAFYSLLTIKDIDALSGSPTEYGLKRYTSDYNKLRILRFWVMEYERMRGKKLRAEEIEESLKKTVEIYISTEEPKDSFDNLYRKLKDLSLIHI